MYTEWYVDLLIACCPRSCTLVPGSICVSLVLVGSRVGGPTWWGWDTGKGCVKESWLSLSVMMQEFPNILELQEDFGQKTCFPVALAMFQSSAFDNLEAWLYGPRPEFLKLSNQESLAALPATFYFLRMRSKNRRWATLNLRKAAHSTWQFCAA